jgi:hypothetical protein
MMMMIMIILIIIIIIANLKEAKYTVNGGRGNTREGVFI